MLISLLVERFDIIALVFVVGLIFRLLKVDVNRFLFLVLEDLIVVKESSTF